MIWLLVASVVGLVTYEIYAAVSDRSGDTISELIWRFTLNHPLIPFLFGVLMGHFFWQRS